MSKNKKIYPLAYELKPNMVRTLYYLGFPQRWKTELLKIDRSVKPNAKDEYGLPTNTLKRMLLAWMDGVVDLAPLKKFSEDSHWLISCTPYDNRALKELCQYIQIWCRATYNRTSYKTMTTSMEKTLIDFCSSMQWEELKGLQMQEKVQLTMEDGTVSGEAYTVVPLLAVNQLLGKTIQLQQTSLRLSYAGKNELVGQPLEDPKSHHKYSFVFTFSLQTTPPDRQALLLCHMSIRRWIYASWYTDRPVYPQEGILAHIKTSDDKFCQVNICGSYSKQATFWDCKDEQCYNVCDYQPLPSAQEIVDHPEQFDSKILLPYKNGMFGFKESKIGTGVPVQDKALLHREILHNLTELVCEDTPEAAWIGEKSIIPTFKTPQDYQDPEHFREWVRSCIETDRIVFELYGLWKDPGQRRLLEQIEQAIGSDFGLNQENSCMQIQIIHKEIGDMVDALENSLTQTQMKHSKHVEKTVGPTQTVTGCIVVIPAAKDYEHKGDPKQAVRNGFARSGRVVQFINPDNCEKSGINTDKIEHSVYDLYRQLGIVSLIDLSKKTKHPMLQVPCVGLHICTQIHSKMRKGRFLPLTVQTDLQTGRTRVSCDAFTRQNLSYREACLEMAQLFWKDDLEKFCTQASFQPAKQLLLKMKNEHRTSDDRVLLLVTSDGNTRPLWNGISDKEIGEYVMAAEYCPKEINVGKKASPFELELLNSGVRIIRLRTNQEVPDYYTDLSIKATDEIQQRAGTSGIFQYGKAFWSIVSRPNDPKFKKSLKENRIDHPQTFYAEKDMAELYPLQLQPGDSSTEWVIFADGLRTLPLQYKKTTVLPLPLHLAKGLEEYLFNV